MIVLFITTALVSALWQPPVIAAIAWLVLRLSRCSNATTRHAIWTIALIASVALPLVSAAPLLLPKQPVPLHAVTSTRVPPLVRQRVPEKTVVKSASSTATVGAQPMERPHFHVRPTIAQIAVGIWGLLALAILARLAFSFLYLERLKHDALPLSVERRHELSRWERAEKGVRDVRVCVSPEIMVPVAVGIFDAMILLPQDLVDELESHDLDRILLHELAHVRRSDDWVNLFERVALALFFFSPGIYWIARQMDLEREVACDDWVLAQAAENVPYARCLTRIVEMTRWPHRPLAAPGVFVTRKSMSIRIERLLARGRDVRIRLAIVPSLMSVVAIAGIVVAGGFVSPTIAYTMDAATVAATKAMKPSPAAKPSHTIAPEKTAAPAHTPRPVPTLTLPPSPDVVVHAPQPALHPAVTMYQKPKTRVSTNASVAVAVAVASSASARVGLETPKVVADVAYLDDLAAAGFKNVSADEVIQMKSVGVTGDYIRQMRAAGVPGLTARALIEMKSVGVTPDYIAQMRAAGLGASDPRGWVEIKSVGVDPSYVSDLRSAGLTGLAVRQLTELKSVGVTPSYVQDLANAGYAKLTPREYTELKSLGVTADYIRGLSNHGFSHLTVEKIVQFKAMGIEPK